MKEIFNNYLWELFKSIDIEFFIKFIVVYFFIIWISLVVWVLKDIRNRTTNVFFQIICLLISVLPFLWIFIYLLLRPSRTLYEKYYEEIEYNLDIINEIIEERKKQFEKKINKSIEQERKIVKDTFKGIEKKEDKNNKINFIYKTELLKNDNKELETEKNFKVKKEIKITQLKKRNF